MAFGIFVLASASGLSDLHIGRNATRSWWSSGRQGRNYFIASSALPLRWLPSGWASSTTTAENSLCGPKVGSAVLVFWLAIMEMFDNKRSRFGYTRCMQAGKFLIEMAGVVQW